MIVSHAISFFHKLDGLSPPVLFVLSTSLHFKQEHKAAPLRWLTRCFGDGWQEVLACMSHKVYIKRQCAAACLCIHNSLSAVSSASVSWVCALGNFDAKCTPCNCRSCTAALSRLQGRGLHLATVYNMSFPLCYL
jgi:hypothetical protein